MDNILIIEWEEFLGRSNEYISQLHDLGFKVLFFIEYVPVDGDTVDLAPSDEEREL